MDVVIIDDSSILRERIVTMLDSITGINIRGEGSNSLEAIELLEKYSPDVFILDIRMPGDNGIKTLKKIKERSSSTVIIFTNYPNEQYKEEAKKAGADYFFSKSDEFEKLFELMKQLAKP